jgi:hypothetical protein
MFCIRVPSAAALAAFLLPVSQAHAGTAYGCEIQQRVENGAWIPDQIVVGENSENGTVVAYDPVIHHFIGHPIEVKVETDNAKRVTYVWTVKAKSRSNQYVRMAYRLTVFKADLRAQMAASPVGYAQDFTAQGSCKKVKT